MGWSGLQVCLCCLWSDRCAVEFGTWLDGGSGCDAAEMEVVGGLTDGGTKEAMRGG